MKNREFYKQMLNLSAAIGASVSKNDSVINAVAWFRSEFVKIPEKYPGDDLIISLIASYAAQGLLLNESIEKAKNQINNEILVLDYQRSTRTTF